MATSPTSSQRCKLRQEDGLGEVVDGEGRLQVQHRQVVRRVNAVTRSHRDRETRISVGKAVHGPLLPGVSRVNGVIVHDGFLLRLLEVVEVVFARDHLKRARNSVGHSANCAARGSQRTLKYPSPAWERHEAAVRTQSLLRMAPPQTWVSGFGLTVHCSDTWYGN